ncbi:MAG TPA: hypothetical protein VF543_20330 [Pyrinomonadaceae bacterium]
MAELFQNFEIHKSPWWERVWRVAAGSVVLHILLLAVVIYVPSVREAFNIASVFSGAKYVDEDYKKTVIGERAVLINAKDVFEYPPGYFSGPMVDQTQLPPQIIATATPVPLPPPPAPVRPPRVRPTPAEALASASPSPSPAASPQATPSAADANAGITENMSKDERDKKLNDIAAQNNIERPNEDAINKKPLKDWLAKAKEAKEKNEIDLTGQIEMTIEADKDADGKLINAVVTSKKGDPKLQELVKEFVAALSDSKALASLKDVKHIVLNVTLNDKEVVVKVSSEVESAERANTLANVYGVFLLGGRIQKRGQLEGTIYQNTRVSANGKAVEVRFTMPRKEATDILTKLSTS